MFFDQPQDRDLDWSRVISSYNKVALNYLPGLVDECDLVHKSLWLSVALLRAPN